MLDTLNMLFALKPFQAALLADTGGSFWLPLQRSTVAPEVDWIWSFILWISVFFFVLITVLVVWFSIRYRYRPGKPEPEAPKHSTALELTWTFIPTVLVVMIFYYGFKEFMRLTVLPPNAYTVTVKAHMWGYSFEYPNGAVDENLHIPVDTPVVFILNSSDVLHGFYIPVFRIKKDIVPARSNKIWVQATNVETKDGYDIFCTQYCGQGHSEMRKKVFIHTKADFAVYMENLSNPNLPPPQMGQRVWQMKGCNGCHSIDGKSGKGPTWKDVWMHEVTLADGSKMVADDDYLEHVIRFPNSHPLLGFPPIMPPTAGLLTEKDIPNVIAFIHTLSDKYVPPAASQPAPQATTRTNPGAGQGLGNQPSGPSAAPGDNAGGPGTFRGPGANGPAPVGR